MLGTRIIAPSLPTESSLSFWEKQCREIRAVHENPGVTRDTLKARGESRRVFLEKVTSEFLEKYSKPK